ncbi:cyclic nucleotide-binding domain-containing protein [Heliobacterium gestii]|uniref:Cyclic nucleotide-binding domain-containing protein n=1 Tax=Heliomicrobium gestii TaxID=2699 RepID=A0A845LA90_HELGE|nr:SLC13 family permease [Heliomicrobium gestii]MBM7867392.1 branched-chain amino acid transport system substrate-binding protein [Heliomicrobium gestii]MZP43657.1 cyclic nucleotide-binding domain-containing protein [Heliomicrobium gestii]
MDIDERLSTIPIFSGLDRINRAKLLPEFEEVQLPAGYVIFREGDRGDSLYVILSGSVSVYREPLPGQKPRLLAQFGASDCFGEMALLTGVPRTATVETDTPCLLARLSKERFDDLLSKHHSLAIDLAKLLSERLAIHSGHDVARAKEQALSPRSAGVSVEEAHPRRQPLWSTIALTWLSPLAPWLRLRKKQKLLALLIFVVLVESLLSIFLHSLGMKGSHIALLQIIAAAALFWSVDVVSPHAVALCLPLAAVLLHAATPTAAFSGFSNSSWFLILGVSALTAGISRTGLMYRLALLVMKRFPPNYGGQTLAWAITGMLLTPVIPSANGRVALMTPMLVALSETLRLPAGSSASVGLAMSCLLGFGHMSFLFMNGAAVCYVVLGLLPQPLAQSLSYQTWFLTAAPLGLPFFLLSLLAILLLFPYKSQLVIKPAMIEAQLKVLGALTGEEKVCLLATSFSLIGFLTQSWHRIDGAWVALTSFLILYVGAVLTDQTIRSGIDWGFLITFGSMLGFGNAMKEAGLTDALSRLLQPLLQSVMGSPLIFLLSVALYITLLRFVLPISPGLLVGMLTVTPLCEAMGLSPLLVGLIMLMACNPWILPNQNAIYFTLLDGTDKRVFTHGQTRSLAILYGMICAISICVAEPYWEMLGLIY